MKNLSKLKNIKRVKCKQLKRIDPVATESKSNEAKYIQHQA